jgi:protein SCO1/2
LAYRHGVLRVHPPGRTAGSVSPGQAVVPGVILAIVAALLAACAASPASTRSPAWVEAVTQAPLGHRDTAYDPPRPAPPLRLTDQDDRPFDLVSLRGRPVFVYFGYTHCPDVCPTTLADLRAAIKASGVDATVVFVTIDPGRDNAAAMKQYVDYYGMDYIGLTGTADEIAATAGAWGVTYGQLPSDSMSGYAMAHSTDSYLVDGDGQLRHHVFFGAPVDFVADLIREVARA